MAYEQVYSIINAMYAQTTGKTDIAVVDTSSFISVANTLLKTGYDNFINSLSNVLTKSIFAWRPYDAKFGIIEEDAERWGNHVRKISPMDNDAVEAKQYSLVDGQSIDPWVVRKPKSVQLNYYDEKTWDDFITLPKHQIDESVRSESEFAQFVAMVIGNLRNKIEQNKEDTRRLTFNNFIMAVYQDEKNNASNGSYGRLVKLLTEYNSLTGLSLTAQSVYQPSNYMPFIQWVSSRIMQVSEHLTDRGYLYHKNLPIPSIMIPRHTPKNYQKLAIMSDAYSMIQNSAFANTFHDKFVKGFAAFEPINFLQSAKDGYRNSVWLNKFVTLNDSNGQTYIAEAQDDNKFTLDNFFGIVFDRDAMLTTVCNEWTQSTGMNPRAGYENLYYHFTMRFCNDFTENAIIFVLE